MDSAVSRKGMMAHVSQSHAAGLSLYSQQPRCLHSLLKVPCIKFLCY